MSQKRIQTTVNISSDAVEALDGLSRASSVSRSRLVDLALRRFIRWAMPVAPKDLKLIADYEVSEPTTGFIRRRTTTVPPPPVNNGDHDYEEQGDDVPMPVQRSVPEETWVEHAERRAARRAVPPPPDSQPTPPVQVKRRRGGRPQ